MLTYSAVNHSEFYFCAQFFILLLRVWKRLFTSVKVRSHLHQNCVRQQFFVCFNAFLCVSRATAVRWRTASKLETIPILRALAVFCVRWQRLSARWRNMLWQSCNGTVFWRKIKWLRPSLTSSRRSFLSGQRQTPVTWTRPRRRSWPICSSSLPKRCSRRLGLGTLPNSGQHSISKL
jgi:hypothetical protein